MRVRQSTAEYFHDAGLRNAVNDLSDENGRILSRGMRWDDYPEFVEAWRASQDVVADFALSLNDCWLAIWGSCNLSGLTALEFDHEIDEEDDWRDPVSIWENWWTGRYFSAPHGCKIWLGAGFEDRLLRIGLYPARNDKLLKLRLDGFGYDADISTYVAAVTVPIEKDGAVEIEQLLPVAEGALDTFRGSVLGAQARSL
jgi:hypothetical protein